MDNHIPSLYNISLDVVSLLASIEENGGEITDESEVILRDLEVMLLTKTDSVCDYVRYLNDTANLIEARKKQLAEAQVSVEKRLERINNYIVTCMNLLDRKEITGELNRVIIRKPSEHVEITDQDSIPISLLVVKEIVEKRPDKMAIKKLIQQGENVPGATLVSGQPKAEIKVRTK